MLAENLINKFSEKKEPNIVIEDFTDLRLMAGGGSVNDTEFERHILSVLVQASDQVKDQLGSKMAGNCRYLLHQLVNHVVIIKTVLYEINDETEAIMYDGKLCFKNIC
jgi:hypothetical protein